MKSEIKSGAILSYISVAFGLLISLIYTPYMLNVLGQSEYGLYSLVNTIIAYFTLLDFGLGNAVVKFTARYHSNNNKKGEESVHWLFFIIFSIIGLITLALGVVLVINTRRIFQVSLSDHEVNLMKILLSLAIINISISFPFSLFSSVIHAYEKFKLLNIIKLIRTILNPLFMVSVLYMGFGSIGMIVAITLLNILFNIFYIHYLKKYTRFKLVKYKIDKGLLKEIYSYSFYIFIAMLVDRLFWSTDQIILGILTSTTEIAVYSIATTFIKIFITITSIIGSFYLPKFTRIIDSNEYTSEVKNLKISDEFYRISRIQFIICLYILLGFYIVGKQFIIIWVGNGYIKSYYIALLIMLGLVLGVTQNVGITVLQAKNMLKFRSIVQLVIAVLNVVLTVVLVYKWGSIGAAFATFITYFFGVGIIMSIYYQKKANLNVSKLLKSIFRVLPIYLLLTALYSKIVSLYFNINNYISVLIVALVFSILYFSFTYFVYLNSNEKSQIKLLLKFKLH